jgi:hypothetical protein
MANQFPHITFRSAVTIVIIKLIFMRRFMKEYFSYSFQDLKYYIRLCIAIKVGILNTLARFLRKIHEIVFWLGELNTRFLYFEVDGSMQRIRRD